MVKLTKRKGFNFFRSYFDVYNELDNDKDKVAFIDALLNRQFLGIKPTDLTGMAKFAYISQTNSIDSQVKGYEDKTKTKLNTPTVPPTHGGNLPPSLQVQEKEKEKEKVQLSILSREAEFKNSLQPYLEIYGKDLLNEFYLYWTEKKPKGRKMLFEMQKTFDILRRLERWSKNNFNKKEKTTDKKEKVNAGSLIQKIIIENNGII